MYRAIRNEPFYWNDHYRRAEIEWNFSVQGEHRSLCHVATGMSEFFPWFLGLDISRIAPITWKEVIYMSYVAKTSLFPALRLPQALSVCFSLPPFPTEIFFLRNRKKNRGIHSNLLNGCLTPFIQPQKCGEIPNFRSRLGGKKILRNDQSTAFAEIQGTSWVSARSSSCRIWRQTL